MKNPTNAIARISLLSLSVSSLNFPHATVATTVTVENTRVPQTLLIAQGMFCTVANIRTGQLALRFSPNGKSRAGLDNGNTVELLQGNPGVWRYVRVLNSSNRRVDGLKGWVNSNYLACGGIDDSGDFASVSVFAPPSNIRTSPNGSVKCAITHRQAIRVYVEPQGAWYSTTACGGGWIHESQIR